MNHLLGPLLVYLVAPSVSPTPVQRSLEEHHSNTATNCQTRHQRKVPETSYALAGNRDYKLDVGNRLFKPENIYNQTDQSNYDGNILYSFAAENGISVQVQGSQKTIGDKSGQVMEGQYSYTAPDGTPVAVKWFADETGFHADVITPSTFNFREQSDYLKG